MCVKFCTVQKNVKIGVFFEGDFKPWFPIPALPPARF